MVNDAVSNTGVVTEPSGLSVSPACTNLVASPSLAVGSATSGAPWMWRRTAEPRSVGSSGSARRHSRPARRTPPVPRRATRRSARKSTAASAMATAPSSNRRVGPPGGCVLGELRRCAAPPRPARWRPLGWMAGTRRLMLPRSVEPCPSACGMDLVSPVGRSARRTARRSGVFAADRQARRHLVPGRLQARLGDQCGALQDVVYAAAQCGQRHLVRRAQQEAAARPGRYDVRRLAALGDHPVHPLPACLCAGAARQCLGKRPPGRRARCGPAPGAAAACAGTPW